MIYDVDGRQMVILSVLVLYLGYFLKHRLEFLRSYSIPVSVVGGVVFSVLASALAAIGLLELTYDLELRSFLLLFFFSTIGLNAKFADLAQGGTALVFLVLSCCLLLTLQNVVGVSVAMLFGRDPLLGIFAGSISLAGGHGTAIAWGEALAGTGVAGIMELGVASATLGLILGGVLGGPLATRIIEKHQLRPTSSPTPAPVAVEQEEGSEPKQVSVEGIIDTIFALALCLALGDAVNRYLFEYEIRLPGFVTAMMVGVLLSNSTRLSRISLHRDGIDLVGGVSLQLFLSMSLLSMDLLAIADSALLLFVILACQVLLATLLATQVVFRMLGRDYDAAMIVGGFFGLGMGATPVAMASMDSASKKYGVSTKALVVVPLIGAFFIDLINAVTIQGFLRVIP